MAQSLSTGNLEILGYIFVIASTVKIGIYQYRSWWRWGREYKPTKVMNFRDGRLSSSETMCLAIGILLVIFLDDSSIFNWILEKVILYSVFSPVSREGGSEHVPLGHPFLRDRQQLMLSGFVFAKV